MRQYFPILDSIRGLACIWVVFSHLGLIYSFSFAKDFASHGDFGVSVFFVLSGFTLTHVYFTKGVSIRKFIVHRIARLYPLVFVLTLFIFLLQSLTKASFQLLPLKDSFWDLVKSLTMTYHIGFNILPINGVFWSIDYEMWGASAYFLLFYITRKNAWLAFSTFIVVTILMRRYYLNIFNPHSFSVLFSTGIIIYYIYNFVQLKRYKDKLPFKYNEKWGFVCISVLQVLVILLTIQQYSRGWIYSFHRILAIYVVLILIYDGLISRILSYKVFTYIGKISFSIYALHLLTLLLFYQVLGIKDNIMLGVILVVITTWILSHLSYHYFENPMRKYIKRKFD